MCDQLVTRGEGKKCVHILWKIYLRRKEKRTFNHDHTKNDNDISRGRSGTTFLIFSWFFCERPDQSWSRLFSWFSWLVLIWPYQSINMQFLTIFSTPQLLVLSFDGPFFSFETEDWYSFQLRQENARQFLNQFLWCIDTLSISSVRSPRYVTLDLFRLFVLVLHWRLAKVKYTVQPRLFVRNRDYCAVLFSLFLSLSALFI